MNPLSQFSTADQALMVGYIMIAMQRDNARVDYQLPTKRDQLMRLGRQLNMLQREIVEKLEASNEA